MPFVPFLAFFFQCCRLTRGLSARYNSSSSTIFIIAFLGSSISNTTISYSCLFTRITYLFYIKGNETGSLTDLELTNYTGMTQWVPGTQPLVALSPMLGLKAQTNLSLPHTHLPIPNPTCLSQYEFRGKKSGPHIPTTRVFA